MVDKENMFEHTHKVCQYARGFQTMLLISYRNSDHVAHASRKIGLFEEKFD